VDVWVNTPKRPYEASGTSGMKAALNGYPASQSWMMVDRRLDRRRNRRAIETAPTMTKSGVALQELETAVVLSISMRRRSGRG